MTRLGGPRSKIYISVPLFCCIFLLTVSKMNNLIIDELPIDIESIKMPEITLSTLNCNTLNMATVTKHTRLRKFYGIASLKTDIVMLSDLRMCDRHGQTDIKFIRDTFAINPHCSYNFFDHSGSNKRGVGILVKKSLVFSCLEVEKDPISDNFILLKAEINNIKVIIGSVYGPNKRDDDFFRRLHTSLERLGNFPIVIAGDWNATYSCLPVLENPDVLNMQNVPNLAHSKKIKDLCNSFNITDPLRILYPNLVDFTYAPWGNTRNNRSRIDFFLLSSNVASSINDCYIKNSVQSKLFDHKAVVLDFNRKIPASSRPTISARILKDPDIEILVKLSAYECYTQQMPIGALKNLTLRLIGRSHKILRDMGPDPTYIEYAYAELLDLDSRNTLKDELNRLIRDLDDRLLEDTDMEMEPDLFMEYLMNNIRNDVINYQSFIFKKISESYVALNKKITALKSNMIANFEEISKLEIKLRDINDLKINSILGKNCNFDQLHNERITPFF